MIHTKVFMSAELDDFKEGCQLTGGTEFGLIESHVGADLAMALKYIRENYGEPYRFDDRLEFQCHETGEGYQPTAAELDKWKAGAMKMWLVNYSFYLVEVTEKKLGHDELKEAFPGLEEN